MILLVMPVRSLTGCALLCLWRTVAGTQLVLSYHMNAAVMCEFSKDEWTSGLVKLNVDSVDKLKRKLPEMRDSLKAEDRFRDVYNYAYLFSREVRRAGRSTGPHSTKRAARRTVPAPLEGGACLRAYGGERGARRAAQTSKGT